MFQSAMLVFGGEIPPELNAVWSTCFFRGPVIQNLSWTVSGCLGIFCWIQNKYHFDLPPVTVGNSCFIGIPEPKNDSCHLGGLCYWLGGVGEIQGTNWTIIFCRWVGEKPPTRFSCWIFTTQHLKILCKWGAGCLWLRGGDNRPSRRTAFGCWYNQRV